VNTTFKRTDASDLECIQMIARKTVDHSYRYFLGDEIVDHYLNSGHLEAHLSNHINNTWALYKGNNILGFSICIDNVIDFMMVDADYHRQGLGTKLLQCCEDLLFENHQVIALESYEKNYKACEFYEANNWRKVAKYIDSKNNEVKYIFRKHLRAETDLLHSLFIL